MKFKKINKKGQTLKSFVIAVLIFSAIVTSFVVVPAEPFGFWEKNNFVEPTNDLLELDSTNNISQTIKQIGCDINPDTGTSNSNSCSGQEDTSKFSEATNFIRNMVQGGYGAIITVTKALGTSKLMIEKSGELFGLPSFLTDVLVSLVFVSVLLTLILILFLRSDSA